MVIGSCCLKEEGGRGVILFEREGVVLCEREVVVGVVLCEGGGLSKGVVL